MAKQRGRSGPSGEDTQDLPKVKLSRANLKKSMRLFTYMRKLKWQFALGMLFLLGTAIVGLIFPLKAGALLSFLGDNTNEPKEVQTHKLIQVGIALGVILLVQSFFSFGRVYFFTLVTESLLKGLRNDVFKRMLQMPMSFFSKNQSAELSSRMATDINVISDAFTFNIAELIRQSVVGIGGLIMMITLIPPQIVIWFLAVIPVVVIITILFAKRIRHYSKLFQDKLAELSVLVGETITGITNVKVFTSEPQTFKRYSDKTEEIKLFGMKYGTFRGAFFAFVVAIIFGAVFFILFLMIKLKIEGVLEAEDFGRFLMLSLFVAASLSGLPDQIASIQKALGATDRVFELIDGEVEALHMEEQARKNNQTDEGAEIEFKDVHFTYPSRPDFNVLNGISFNAKRGESIALVGSSGSGKSTIASLMLRFYQPQTGSICLNGETAESMDLTRWREHIALVPQDVILFAGTIKENIAYGKANATDAEIEEAARKANALDFIQSFPDKFNTLVGERGIQLSGGQRQRIAIARAVLKNPAVLILDEATSSLDSESEHLVQEALDKLMQGRTSIVIAHRLSTIRNSDTILVMDKGKVVESGNHEQLLSNPEGFYYKLNKMQFELNAV
jgi:ABC-type multidrug transport system fused ATPase/permease subunit